MTVWGMGSMIVIFLAGLQNVPKSYLEAVEIDGGNAWHKFRHITIPMMTPIIFFNFLMSMITNLQVFVPAYALTQGGPSGKTLFMVYLIYREGFMRNNIRARQRPVAHLLHLHCRAHRGHLLPHPGNGCSTRESEEAMEYSKRNANIVVTILISLIGLAVLFPFFWMVRSSFMSNIEIHKYPPLFLPTSWRFDNYPYHPVGISLLSATC